MAAQFHSICLIKGVYVAQWNFRINPSRVATTSPQIKKSITYIISDLPNTKTCARESGLGWLICSTSGCIGHAVKVWTFFVLLIAFQFRLKGFSLHYSGAYLHCQKHYNNQKETLERSLITKKSTAEWSKIAKTVQEVFIFRRDSHTKTMKIAQIFANAARNAQPAQGGIELMLRGSVGGRWDFSTRKSQRFSFYFSSHPGKQRWSAGIERGWWLAWCLVTPPNPVFSPSCC